jgi:XTP/dITP diphosphohydrolase
MKNHTLLVGTNNAHKAREIAALLQELAIRVATPGEIGITEEPEETGLTFAENAAIKANYYARQGHLPCLADDSGLVVDALQGRPGIYSARYAPTDSARIARLLEEMRGVPETKRTARFVCVMALSLPDASEILETGICEGIIAEAPQGNNGFGYDPIFYLPHLQRTLAEISDEEKNHLSHRGNALESMKPHLVALFSPTDSSSNLPPGK